MSSVFLSYLDHIGISSVAHLGALVLLMPLRGSSVRGSSIINGPSGSSIINAAFGALVLLMPLRGSSIINAPAGL